MVSLGQKVKRPKTWEKRFYKHVTVVLCKKTAGKNTKYSTNETIFKIGNLAKTIDFAKWSVWLKNANGQKRAKNDSTSTLELFCAKKRLKNTKYSRNETIFKFSHLAKPIDFAKWSVWLKNLQGQKRAKNDSTSTLELFSAKNRLKNTKYSRNETIFKFSHLAKAIDFAKWSVWLKNSNGQKRPKNDSASTLECFCAKNRCKKHQIFQKWDHFEIQPSCKGYRLCKMVRLVQKLKWPKPSEKRFWKHVRVFLCKKPLKKHQIFQKWDHFENRPSCKGYRLCKMVRLGQKDKGQKRAKNDSTSTLQLLCAKNRLKKHQIFEKWDHFENRPSSKAIDFARWSIWVKNSNGQKHAKNDTTSTLELFCAKNRLKKHQIFEKWDHFENLPSCKGCRLRKWPVWVKDSSGQKRAKNDSASKLELFCAKNRLKKHQIFKNETILKIGDLAKARDFAKWSVWLKNSKDQKRANNDSASKLELFCAKKRLKKHQIFEKWDHFENRPSCKGYRLCKMVNLAQKFKWPETCEKRY